MIRRAFLVMGLILPGLAACEMIAVTALNQIELTEFEVRGTELFMSGEINSKTMDQFNAIYAAHPEIKTLVELDVPGSLDDETMIPLAYRIRSLRLNTKLLATSEIYSGGVDLFLAGVERTIERGATIGVHAWADSTNDATDYPRGAPEHELYRKYVEDMLGSDGFYWFTIYAAPPDGIHIMSNAELRQFGVATGFVR